MVSYNSITGQCTHIILRYYVPAVIESSHPQGHWCLMREEIGLFFTVMNGRVPVIIMLCRISYFPQAAKSWCTHFPHQLSGEGHLLYPVYIFCSYSLKLHKKFQQTSWNWNHKNLCDCLVSKNRGQGSVQGSGLWLALPRDCLHFLFEIFVTH